MLGVLQARGAEYIDAINYAQTILKNQGTVMSLLEAAEKLKQFEKRVSQGAALSQEEM